MFRLKIVVLYLLLTVLSGLIVHFAVREGIQTTEERLSARVTSGFAGFDKLHELQQLSMYHGAQRVANGRLRAYLKTLEDYREELLDLERVLYDPSRWPHSGKAAEETRYVKERLRYVREQTTLPQQMAQALAANLEEALGEGAFGKKSRDDFVADARRRFEQCAVVAMTQCFYDFTYPILMEEWKRLVAAEGSAFRPDVLIVMDERGTGLANTRDPAWSDKRDFGRSVAVYDEAMRSGVGQDIMLMGLANTYHFITVVPVTWKRQHVGAILAGVEIDSPLLRELASTLGMDVAFLLKGKVVQAYRQRNAFKNFLDRVVAKVGHEMPARSTSLQVRDDHYAGVAFYYERGARALDPGAARSKPREIDHLQVVLALDEMAALEGLRTVQALIPVATALLFFVGVFLLLFFVRQYTKPFEAIDSGIHEVIAGNYDHRFTVDSHEELPRAIAQNLNLMVALLTGKPIEEESEDAAGWARRMLFDHDTGTEGAVPTPTTFMEAVSAQREGSNVEVVSTLGPRQLREESAEQYYRRVYQEYEQARRRLGLGDEGLSYQRFVEKLARNEQKVRQRLGARSVRFNVVIRDGKVVFTPVVLD